MQSFNKRNSAFIYSAFSEDDRALVAGILDSIGEIPMCCAQHYDKGEARDIEASFAVLLFVSESFLSQPWAAQTITRAIECNKRVLCVYLEPVELNTCLAMQLGSLQSISRGGFAGEQAFLDKFKTSAIFKDMKPTPCQKKRQRNRAVSLVTVPICAAVVLYFTVISPLLIAPNRPLETESSEVLGIKGLTRQELEQITELYILGNEAVDHSTHAWYASNDKSLLTYDSFEGERPVGTYDIPAGSLSDISDLKYLVNLEILEIEGQQITDITPLLGLTKLKELRLNCNPITSLEGIEQLTSLEELTVTCTEVSDLTPAFKLPNLRHLRVDNTYVRSIAGIEALDRLDALFLDDTYVTDLAPLESVDFSDRTVTLSFRQLQLRDDFSFLENIESLTDLYIDDIDIDALSQALNGKSVRFLAASGSNITSVSQLEGIRGIECLHLGYSDRLASLEGIEQFSLINEVKLVDCRALRNLSPLLGLPGLRLLQVDETMRGLCETQLADAQFEIRYQDY